LAAHEGEHLGGRECRSPLEERLRHCLSILVPPELNGVRASIFHTKLADLWRVSMEKE
jgi:hypothetical protein